MRQLTQLHEPQLMFGHSQALEDPRDGLTLFGPLDEGKPYGIRYGVVGTKDGIRRFRKWVERIQGPIANRPPSIARPPFPGFEAAFSIPWNPEPVHALEVHEKELLRRVHLDDKHKRVYETVDLYSDVVLDARVEEEAEVDVWFVVIPDEVRQFCRPRSVVPSEVRVGADHRMTRAGALAFTEDQLLDLPEFKKIRQDARPYEFEPDFHNQLKGRLLLRTAPTQIVREPTIAYREFTDNKGRLKFDLEKSESAIAWNIATTAFYKAGGRPWKIGSIRDGVCYIGLAFKLDRRRKDSRAACCAAQMFLDSGDGVVFKGAVGPWYAADPGEYHLNRSAATELAQKALKSYEQLRGGPPRELFLHGRVKFSDDEWAGFGDAVGRSTNLVGVCIQKSTDIKLYKGSNMPILRGLAHIVNDKIAYLWTMGFIPRLNTYPGREVPKPLRIDIAKGRADIKVVLQDIMALTKLNYNACIFADGPPVTLKFADAVGEILTAGPVGEIPPLPFKYYI